MCGGCDDAYRDYQLALKSHSDAVNVLLVDSEGPVTADDSNGDHLRQRKWNLPKPFDSCYHLMVQAMEALFVADVDALEQHYGQYFRRTALPTHANLEDITVAQLVGALKTATRETTAGEYRKNQHAAKLLSKLDVVKVRAVLPHCDQLFEFLESII
jgi:hypothetical protein